jgi:hypothetical protein
MRLQGIIDANVMGGITKYQEAFLTPEFARQNAEMVSHVNRLKNLILDQMSVLEAGLLLHGQIAPAGVQPLHKRLIERFTQLKQGLGPMTRQRLLHQDSIIKYVCHLLFPFQTQIQTQAQTQCQTTGPDELFLLVAPFEHYLGLYHVFVCFIYNATLNEIHVRTTIKCCKQDYRSETSSYEQVFA